MDNLFDERPIQRFWFLEIIARIPYFSYVSMLHLYESFGWWRGPELRKVHNAEEWNELHHLLIMESLGGNALWSDRFLGYHVAFAYYWFLNAVYLCSPRIAYQFMELLEAHAVDTYTTFVAENRDRLAQLPPPSIARNYYKDGDLYQFDDFQVCPIAPLQGSRLARSPSAQDPRRHLEPLAKLAWFGPCRARAQVSRVPGSRRPACDTLLDVFSNIAVDEGEHVKTMQACQDYALLGNVVVSPHATDRAPNEGDEDSAARAERRKLWKQWAEDVNSLSPSKRP